MANVFFISYGGPDLNGNVHTPHKAVVHTVEEAIAAINTWHPYGSRHSECLSVNETTEKKIREIFRDGLGNKSYAMMRTTGCGAWSISFVPAMADTLEEHMRIANEQREKAKAERLRKAAEAKQRRLAELNEQRNGWYEVSMNIRLYVFASTGNDYRPLSNYTCKIIASSGMNAYNITADYLVNHPEELTHRGNFAVLESFPDPTSKDFRFTFLGEKTSDGYSL